MSDIKGDIYKVLLENKDKKCAILWSGGGYSGLIWYLAYKDLEMKLPIYFIDDGTFPPSLYSFIISNQRKHKLSLSMVQVESGKVDERIAEIVKQYDIVYSGKPKEGCVCPLPENREIWNLLKVLRVPYFRAK